MSEVLVKQIHEASMKILEQAGIRFHHPDALKVLKEHGVRVESGIAYFTEAQVMDWIGKAPATAKIYADDPQYDVVLGGDRSWNAPAAGPTQILETDGTLRPANMADFVKMLKLYEANPSYSINGGVPCQPEKVPEQWSTLLLLYSAFLHSRKSIWSGSGNYEQMEAVIELTKLRYGVTDEELKAKPRIMTIVNTDTPLQFDINMTETMLTFLKYRQPLCVAAASMAGTTSPVTLGGTLAMANAEIIAALVLAQMYAPGAPVIYGSQSTNADLRSAAIAIGSPEGALCYKYCGELAQFYGIPSRAGGCLTDAKQLDVQAGYESMLTYYACREGKVNAIFQSAGILNSYLAASFEKMITDFEVIDFADRYLKEFEINDETVPLELIKELGPGEQYLTEEHTLEYCRMETLTPNISARGPMADPAGALKRNIAKRMGKLLDSYQPPVIDKSVLDGMRNLLRSHGISDQDIQNMEID